VVEPFQRDLGALHLPDQRRIGERIQEREGLEVHAIRLPGEEQRVGLDRVEHRRGRAFGDVHVHGAEVLGEDRAGRAVVGADVLENCGVARLLRMMIDDEIDLGQQAAEVVRLHVHGGDSVEALEVGRRDGLDLDVEQVGHAQVLGARHALQRPDDRGRARPSQHVAQREAGRQGVRVGFVVQEDEHAIGIGEVALVLLDAGPGERAPEFGREGGREEFGEIEVRDLGHDRAEILLGAAAMMGVGVQDVEQAAAGVADRRDDAFQAAPAGVFDDHAGVRRDVGAEVRIDAARVGDRRRHAVVHQPPCEWAAFDQELDVEGPGQHAVQRSNDQLVL
jgi:hypothetical protein